MYRYELIYAYCVVNFYVAYFLLPLASAILAVVTFVDIYISPYMPINLFNTHSSVTACMHCTLIVFSANHPIDPRTLKARARRI